MLSFFDQIQQIVLTMIRLVMYIAPIGVFCLLAALAGDVGFCRRHHGAEATSAQPSSASSSSSCCSSSS